MNKFTILIATTNNAKRDEYKHYLKDVPITVIDLHDAKITQKPEETGSTFTENAIIKAKFYQAISGLPVIVDDGGFEIDALGGKPGVHSHRIVNTDREDTDDEIITYVMEALKTVQPNARGAQLRLVLGLMLPSKEIHLIEEASKGIVGLYPSQKREVGFPYRSLLYFPEIKKYYSELTAAEMEQYNHRRRAIEKIIPIIKRTLC